VSESGVFPMAGAEIAGSGWPETSEADVKIADKREVETLRVIAIDDKQREGYSHEIFRRAEKRN